MSRHKKSSPRPLAKPSPNAVAQALGTADPSEQVQRIQALQGPVVAITVQWDTRTGTLTLGQVGATLTTEQVRMVLSTVVENLIRQEARAAPRPGETK